MLKNGLRKMIILASVLITTACRTENVTGVLVGSFSDEEPMFSTIAIPPAEDGQIPMYFALHQSDRVCLLTGQIPGEKVLFFGDCEGVSGAGRISCNDGRTLSVQWTLTSCEGGYGRSTEAAGSNFFFGFDLNEERALEQLRKVQQKD